MRGQRPPCYHWLSGWLAAVLVLAACGSSSAGTPTLGAPASTRAGVLLLAPCHLSAEGLSARRPAECGTLAVSEDPSNPAGRQIGLRVAVVRARGRSPAPDPLFFLTGGPGQAASESFLQIGAAFDEVNNQRDIILVDQRGTGQSNPLDCPVADDPQAVDTLAERVDSAAECLAQLDGDPRFYTTAIAVDDLERVRTALGYDRINLYGVSYGTRAALTYLRQYPDRVRVVILDGVVPPEEALGLHVARDAQRALEFILERCAAEPACRAAFPDLRSEFADLAARLAVAPQPVEVDHPLTGERLAFDFTYDAFASTIRLLSYAPETVALLPLLIHTAHAQDDFRLLAAQSLIVGEDLSASISSGMSTSVLCSEDAPFITPGAAEAANAGAYLGSAQTDWLQAVCARWPAGDLPPGFKEPVTAEVPVLLLSGEADPVTPPAYGEQVAAALPNSLHLVAPGMGHNVVIRGCLPRLTTDFIESGSLAGLDTACVGGIAPLPFFVDFTGPPP